MNSLSYFTGATSNNKTMADSSISNTTESCSTQITSNESGPDDIILRSIDPSDIGQPISSVQPGPNSQLNPVMSRMAAGTTNIEIDRVKSSEELLEYMMPTKALLDELEGMASFQILLALDSDLARISKTEGTLNTGEMIELLKMVIQLLKHVRDENYDEITDGYKNDEFDMKMEVNCLYGIKGHVASLSTGINDSIYRSSVEKEFVRIANFIIVRHDHNIILNFKNSLSCDTDYSDVCRYYASKGMIPVIDWTKSTITQRINEDTSVQDILRKNTEQCCPVCLSEDINEDLNFAILDSCHHLACSRCAESIFYRFDDEEQKR